MTGAGAARLVSLPRCAARAPRASVCGGQNGAGTDGPAGGAGARLLVSLPRCAACGAGRSGARGGGNGEGTGPCPVCPRLLVGLPRWAACGAARRMTPGGAAAAACGRGARVTTDAPFPPDALVVPG